MDISDEEWLSLKRTSIYLAFMLNRKIEVYLYGSRAKSTSRSDSDFDIAIKILDKCDHSKLWMYCGDTLDYFFKYTSKLNTHVELIDDKNGIVAKSVEEMSRKIYP